MKSKIKLKNAAEIFRPIILNNFSPKNNCNSWKIIYNINIFLLLNKYPTIDFSANTKVTELFLVNYQF
jgi:hypothetical protein